MPIFLASFILLIFFYCFYLRIRGGEWHQNPKILKELVLNFNLHCWICSMHAAWIWLFKGLFFNFNSFVDSTSNQINSQVRQFLVKQTNNLHWIFLFAFFILPFGIHIIFYLSISWKRAPSRFSVRPYVWWVFVKFEAHFRLVFYFF